MKGWILATLFLLSSLAYAWTIEGNSVYENNSYAYVSVTPHTAAGYVGMEQQINLTYKLGVARKVNVSIYYDRGDISNPHVFQWENWMHEKLYYVDYQYDCSWFDNVTWHYQNCTGTNTTWVNESYYDWRNRDAAFSSMLYKGKRINTISNLAFAAYESKLVKITYDVPRGSSGKYTILFYQGSLQAVANGSVAPLLELDPWYVSGSYAYWIRNETYDVGLNGIYLNLSQNSSLVVNRSMGSDKSNITDVFLFSPTSTTGWTAVHDGGTTGTWSWDSTFGGIKYVCASSSCDDWLRYDTVVGAYNGSNLSFYCEVNSTVPASSGVTYPAITVEHNSVATGLRGFATYASYDATGQKLRDDTTSLATNASNYPVGQAWWAFGISVFAEKNFTSVVNASTLFYNTARTKPGNKIILRGAIGNSGGTILFKNCRVSKYILPEPTVSCIDLDAGHVQINVTSAIWDGSRTVFIPMACINDTQLLIGDYNETATNSPPALASLNISPATLYSTSLVNCTANYTDDGNVTFTAFMVLANNGTVLDAYNTTNSTYANATAWTVEFDLTGNFSVGDNASCGSYADDGTNASALNFTQNVTIVTTPVPSIAFISPPTPANNSYLLNLSYTWAWNSTYAVNSCNLDFNGTNYSFANTSAYGCEAAFAANLTSGSVTVVGWTNTTYGWYPTAEYSYFYVSSTSVAALGVGIGSITIFSLLWYLKRRRGR